MIHTNEEKKKSLAKSYLDIKDIMILLDCSQRVAKREKDDYLIGRRFFLNRIPTSLFVADKGIDEERILRYAEMGL